MSDILLYVPMRQSVIDGDQASTGFLTGKLPKAPVRISAYPAGFTRGGIHVFARELPDGKQINEQPGPDNGWDWGYKGRGWVRVAADHPAATEDLNRLIAEARWDRRGRRWEPAS